MNPDILLIYPPHDVRFYQPIGLPTLATHLIKQGMKVEILDAVAEGMNHQQVIKYIMKNEPEIIGISIPFTEMATSGDKLLELCRVVFPDKTLCIGGHHTRICIEDYMEYADLVAHISPDTIPSWDLMPIDKYDLNLYLSTKERAFPIQSSYGCPFSCAFCTNSLKSDPVRYKSIDCVIEEIKYIIKTFGVHGFHFWDETFTLNYDRTEKLCRRLIDENLDIRWTAQTRVGTTDYYLLALMEASGCVRLSLGIESGDKRVLESINKKINLDQAVEDVKLISDIGIISYAGYMIGHAEDTIESVTRTIEFSRELNTDFAGFRLAIPYPGSLFREQAEKKGTILADSWDDYRDDSIVYVPEGLQSYSLTVLQTLANDYFNGVTDGQHILR